MSGATGIIPEGDISAASGLPELEKLQSSIKVKTDLLKVSVHDLRIDHTRIHSTW